MTQFRFTYVIIVLTAILVYTVHVRTTSSRVFHKLERATGRQMQLNQTLRQKQLAIETIISPAAIAKRLRQQEKADKQ